jgi:hypothetical protein
MTRIGIMGAAMLIFAAQAQAGTFGGSDALAHTAPQLSYTVLYNSTGSNTSIGVISQNFEPAYAVYDAADAGFFATTPGSHWSIYALIVSGTYFNGTGPATNVDLTFYKVSETTGLPTTPVKGCQYTNLSVAVDRTGTFSLALPNNCNLRVGQVYALSVVANMPTALGEWGWSGSTYGNSSDAVWKNPAGGWHSKCKNWKNEMTCVGNNGQGNFKSFELLGD